MITLIKQKQTCGVGYLAACLVLILWCVGARSHQRSFAKAHTPASV